MSAASSNSGSEDTFITELEQHLSSPTTERQRPVAAVASPSSSTIPSAAGGSPSSAEGTGVIVDAPIGEGEESVLIEGVPQELDPQAQVPQPSVASSSSLLELSSQGGKERKRR